MVDLGPIAYVGGIRAYLGVLGLVEGSPVSMILDSGNPGFKESFMLRINSVRQFVVEACWGAEGLEGVLDVVSMLTST